MQDSRADAIIRRYGQMSSARGIWESHWQEIADRVLPHMASFNAKLTDGAKHTEKIFDATACLAVDRYASAVESLICPRNEQWHKLQPASPALAENDECKRWCEALTDLLFRYRYMPSANFSSQVHECLLSLGAFGTTAMLVDDSLRHPSVAASPSPIVYQSQPLDSLYIAENAAGQVDTVMREFNLTGRQAVQEFKDKTPPKIKQAADKGDERQWSFLHCVYPSDDVGPWGWDKPAGARFIDAYVSRDEKVIVQDGFVSSFPFSVSRNVTAPRETYGRSPAMIVLPDIKMLNEVAKTDIRARQKVVDPPLLLADDSMGPAFDLRPGSLNYGHVDQQGRQLVHPLMTGARLDAADEMKRDLRTSINDAFLITLFQILVENREMTAYEAALRAQEKGQLLAPTMGRQETEFLAPTIEREIDILWKRGIIQAELPPMPDALMMAGGALKIVYTSPLSRLQMAGKAVAIQSWLSDLAPIAQVNVAVVDNVDFDAVATMLADARGVPQSVRRTPQAIEAIRNKKTEQADQQALLDAAPVAAASAKDAAQAVQIAGQQPAPPVIPLAA